MSELRLSAADRERAVEALGDHFAEGRLTKDEYDERTDAAWTARTASDVRPLFADLPGGSPLHGPPAPGRPLPTGPTPRSRARDVWRGLPTGAQVALAIVLAVLVLANLPIVLVVGLVWLVMARHGCASRPGWAGSRRM